jgi:NADPH-dependent ferric siderophore reductase
MVSVRSAGKVLIDRLFVRGTVTATDLITPRMRRITVAAPGLEWTRASTFASWRTG